MATINPAKDFKLNAELTYSEEADIRSRLSYHENMRQALLVALAEIAKLREEVNILKGV